MIVSRNEVETGCYRAALGVGLSPGLAEEAAQIAARVSAACSDPVPLLLTALANAEANAGLVPFIKRDGMWRAAFGTLPVLIAAPALADLRAAGEPVEQSFTVDVNEILTAAFSPADTAAEPITVDPGVWEAFQALGARTYVTSSERSRLKGAGAGLRDSD